MSSSSERLFKKGEIVAVRSEDDDFYLGRLLQHVYVGLENARIWWLEEERRSGGVVQYRFGQHQAIPVDSIMTPVKLKKVDKHYYEMSDKERANVKDALDHSIMGKGFSDDDDDDDDDDDSDEGIGVEGRGSKRKTKTQKGPAKKKGGAAGKKGAAKSKPARGKSAAAAKKGKGKAAPKKEKAGKGKKEKKKDKEKETKKRGGKRLRVRDDVKVLDKDPFFQSPAKHSFVSPVVEAKLLFRALNTNDNALFKKILKNASQVPSGYDSVKQSVDVGETVMQRAFRLKNVEAVKLLFEQREADKKPKFTRVNTPPCLLTKQGTGDYNFKSLGHAVRKIELSRGSREGNNALIKDDDSYYWQGIEMDELSKVLAAIDVSWQYLQSLKPLIDKHGDFNNLEVEKFVERGNHEVLYHLIDEKVLAGGCGYSNLFRDVLTYPGCKSKAKGSKKGQGKTEDTEDPVLGPKAVLRHASIVKKEYGSSMTPLHFACINPKPDYLDRLLMITPDVNLQDKRRKRPIHYAAVNKSPGCLRLLLDRGASPDEVDSQGNTAMIYACRAGRGEVIKALIEHGKGKNPIGVVDKFGVAGVNRGNRFSYAPIHEAVTNGHAEVVELLVKNGADVEKPLSASKNKVTPFMLACQRGNLAMMKSLVKHGAKIDAKDKLKRSSLMHCVINGQTAAASFLIHAGVDVNHVDTSGNSALLYSVAYGWFFSTKLLIESGADINLPNTWKVPPLGIAFLKGHLGLFEYLLDCSTSVDINYKDLEGSSLVMHILKGSEPKLVVDQLEYLVKEKKAICDFLDVRGNSCLHYLCLNSNLIDRDASLAQEAVKEKQTFSSFVIKAAKILIDAGCPVDVYNEEGNSALSFAASNGCVQLMKLLLRSGASLVRAETDPEKENKENILHLMARHAEDPEFLAFMESILTDKKNSTTISHLKSLMNHFHSEKAPLHVVLEKLFQVYNLHPNQRLSREEIEKKQQTCLKFFKLYLQELKGDVNQAERVVRSGGLVSDGDAPLHSISRCGGFNDFWQTVFDSVLSLKPNLHRISYRDDQNGRTPLNVAVRNGSDRAVKILLDQGCKPNFQDKDFLPLSIAVKSGNVSKMTLLLSHGADVNLKDASSSYAPLHTAVAFQSQRTLSVIDILLKHGASPNTKDNNQRTPLHLAVNALKGHTDESTEVVEKLIAHKADVFAQDSRGRTPLHYVFVKIGAANDDRVSDPIEPCTLMTNSMKFQRIDTEDKFGSTPLYYAAGHGATVCCMHLLKRGANINKKNLEGNSPLSVAIRNSHRSCVLHLIQCDSNLNANIYPFKLQKLEKEEPEEKKPEPWRWLPSQKVEKDPEDIIPIIQKVMQHNWQGELYVMMDMIEKWGLTLGDVIKYAITCSQLQVAFRLARKCTNPKDLSRTVEKGRNLLHFLALHSKHNSNRDTIAKLVDQLIKAGISLLQPDDYGCSPFHYCVYLHDFTLARLLLSNVAAAERARVFSARTKMDHTVVTCALWKIGSQPGTHEYCKTEILPWMDTCKQNGADLNALAYYPQMDPLYFDETEWFFQRIDGFLSGTNVNKVKKSALIVGIELRWFEFVKKMLNLGADVNLAEPLNQRTPLMTAIRYNQEHIVNVILAHDYVIDHEPKYEAVVESDGSFDEEEEEEDNEDEKDEDYDEENDADNEEENEVDDEQESEAEDKDEDENMDQDENEEENEQEDEKEDENSDMEQDEEEDNTGKLTSRNLFLNITKKPEPEKKAEVKKAKEIIKTSRVDLLKKDANKWSLGHHLVAPVKGATFCNVKILSTLYKNGMILDDSVVQLASSLENGNLIMLKTIYKLMGKKLSKSPLKPNLPNVRDVLPKSIRVDYRSDSKSFLDSLSKSASQSNDVEVDRQAIPRNERDFTSVVLDEEAKIHYDYVGSKVDVGYGGSGGFGLFNYYKLQVVYQAGKDLHILVTRWGRFGDSGKYQRTPFESKEAAVKEFKSVFKAKTGNVWDQVKFNNFESYKNFPRKYRILPMEKTNRDKFEGNDSNVLNLKSQLKSGIEDEFVTRMFADLTRPDVLSVAVKQMTNEEGSATLLAFGNTSRDYLLKALDVLKAIGKLLDEREAAQDFAGTDADLRDKNEENYEKIFQLSNEFYHLVPLNDVNEVSLKPIYSRTVYFEKLSTLKKLLDIHTSALILAGAQHKSAIVHPFDYIYKSLDCKIRSLAKEDDEAQRLLRYIHASNKKVTVHGIYALQREGELEKVVAKGIGNHKLLFHGTGKENVLSILARGLLIAPPEANLTGHAFGKGVYFADQFCKSSAYTYNRSSTRRGKDEEIDANYVFVCQVALGKPEEKTSVGGSLPPNFNSRWIRGSTEPRPDEDLQLVVGGGPVLPLGDLVKPKGHYGWRSESEYIIFDEGQIALRYLIRYT